MDLYNESCSPDWPGDLASVLHGENLSIWHYMQSFEQIAFISAMLRDIVDFYHCLALPLTLTLPGGHKVNESKTYWLHLPHALFS